MTSAMMTTVAVVKWNAAARWEGGGGVRMVRHCPHQNNGLRVLICFIRGCRGVLSTP